MGQHAKHTASSPDAAQVTGMSSREGVEAYKRLPRLMSLLRNAQICRETGKEHMVQVHSGEGLANHPGPEPCGGLREGTDEKSVGGHVGEVWRRESC
jgi:hypothetical protein